ncbi:Putative leucine-rich repeat domain superfamily [Colletotrichum destructivum]|uniref:Leucine-rich repeat domain superfamily n=1 Tax=Colletotrichum destructivum TaxID=34406 RepID=A0AAX4HZ96_9PEZI|nr:Putative leucine-rich repeat domain superfamily [Colletotrichum destructivum]
MATNFEKIPQEIIEQICLELRKADYSSLLSLSRVSRRLRNIAITAIVEKVQFAGTQDRVWGHPEPQDNRPGLLRMFMENPDIAYRVKEISNNSCGHLVLSEAEFQTIALATTRLGAPVPQDLYKLLLDPLNHPGRGIRYHDADEGLVQNFMTDIIIAHTPNLRTLEYHVSQTDPRKAFQTLSQVSNATGNRPLLSKLVDCRLHLDDCANLAQPLADAAPNLDSLWIIGPRGLEAPLQLHGVRVLILTGADFTATEISELLKGFPGLKKFWYNSARQYRRSNDRRELCSPQDVADALGPVKSQLLELSLMFGVWQQQPRRPGTGPFTPRLLTSVRDFEALEHLDLDGGSLWNERGDYTNYVAENTDLLAKLLPGRLRKLALLDLSRGPFNEDLSVFVGRSEQVCPDLKVIRYELKCWEKVDMKWMKEITMQSQKHGVTIEDTTATSDDEDDVDR